MFALDKPVGPTAAQALTALRDSDPSLRGLKLGHAGRLDPLAEGLLTVLVGDENRDVRSLRAQPKTYELDVLLGVGTDSFDELGLVTSLTDVTLDPTAVERACSALVGTYLQRYPPFSQARVDGRSLIALGHAGTHVDRPSAERTLHELTFLGLRPTDATSARERALRRIAFVRGDFRQGPIAERWRSAVDRRPDTPLTVASLRVHCSAGTYMRALAHDLGASLGLPAIASRIRRTRSGDLTLDRAREILPPIAVGTPPPDPHRTHR